MHANWHIVIYIHPHCSCLIHSGQFLEPRKLKKDKKTVSQTGSRFYPTFEFIWNLYETTTKMSPSLTKDKWSKLKHSFKNSMWTFIFKKVCKLIVKHSLFEVNTRQVPTIEQTFVLRCLTNYLSVLEILLNQMHSPKISVNIIFQCKRKLKFSFVININNSFILI